MMHADDTQMIHVWFTESSFQKYTTCWVFLALRHMLYLCICVFVFLYLCVRHMGISFLISLNNPLFKNMPYVGSFWHFIICCICVFVYLCICVFVNLCICDFDDADRGGKAGGGPGVEINRLRDLEKIKLFIQQQS